MTKIILLTGAAGDIGSRLRPMLRARYDRVILSDREEIDDLQEGEQFRQATLDDAKAVAAMVAGVDGIVHLGGQPVEAPWEVVDASNIQGMQTVMSAAHAAGVQRFVFASSNHAIGMYPRHRRIGVNDPVRPDGRYGLSKAFGEALCALYADKHGMRCLSIRIGNVSDKPADLRRLSIWIHPEDLFQLTTIGLEHPDLHNAIVFGASDNARSWWDNAPAFALGYRPEHRAEDHRDYALQQNEALKPDPIGDHLQGGGFGSAEFDGDLDRALWS